MKYSEIICINNLIIEARYKNKMDLGGLADSIKRIDKYINKFFTPKKKKIILDIVDSRKEFNKLLNRKTPHWFVAQSDCKKNTIYIFNEKLIRKYSKYDFNRILLHEMIHIALHGINKKIPIWLDEGLAAYLSKQRKTYKVDKNSWLYFLGNYKKKDISFDQFANNNGYRISYFLIRDIFFHDVRNDELNKLIKNCHKQNSTVMRKYYNKIDQYIRDEINKAP